MNERKSVTSSSQKKQYISPKLKIFGTVAKLTLGGGGGTNDGGGVMTKACL